MLIKSSGNGAFSKNVSTEISAGKPQKQAIAIAYSVKKKALNKKNGGKGV
jgi:hypothetical protein